MVPTIAREARHLGGVADGRHLGSSTSCVGREGKEKAMAGIEKGSFSIPPMRRAHLRKCGSRR
jgi:hypothetical protein